MRRLTLALLSAAVATTAWAADAPRPKYGDWGFDAAGLDAKVKPGDDFWRYANGGWDARTPIPADKTRYGVDYILSDDAERQVRAILEEPPAAGAAGAEAADDAKVHAAFSAFMDEARIEKLDAQPLQPDLEAIRGAKTRGDLAELGARHGALVPSVFDIGIGPDDKDPDRYAVGLGQSGLGLPDRDYYLQPQFAAKKAAYRAYVARMLGMIGWTAPDAAAAEVVAFETRIAQASWSRAEERDPVKTYNPTTPAALAKAAPGFPWARFLKGAELSDGRRLIVAQRSAFPKIAAIYAAEPLPQLKAWAAFHAADDAAPYLSHRFDDARFAFRGTTLGGQPEQRARWKRGVQTTDRMLGEAVGRVYVARHFSPEAKAKIDALVTELRAALDKRIDRLDWMGAETKAKAHAKLARFPSRSPTPTAGATTPGWRSRPTTSSATCAAPSASSGGVRSTGWTAPWTRASGA